MGVSEHTTGLASRCDNTQESGNVGPAFRHDAHEGKCELVDDRRAILRGRAYFDIGGDRIAPLAHVCLCGLHQIVECLAIEGRIGGRADRAFVLGQGRACRIVGKTCEHIPTRAVLVVQAEGGREIVDAGFALVGAVAIFAQPEESLANNQLGQSGTVLVLCRFAHLLTKGLEGRVVYRLRRRDRDNLVGANFSGW